MSAYPAPAAARRRLIVALGVAALAILALTFGEAAPETARAANPPCTFYVQTQPNATCGMSLAAPATVAVGQPFTVTISTAPSPPEFIAGFAAEVLYGAVPELDECDNWFDDDGDFFVNDGCPQVGLAPEVGRFCANAINDDGDAATAINDGCPQVGASREIDQCAGDVDDDGDGFVNDGCPPASAGLTWLQRASCEDEVQVARKDGGGFANCNSFDTIGLGGAAQIVQSDFSRPLANLNVAPGSTTPLVELDFVCNTPGSHRLTLTAVPDLPFGAIYASPDAVELHLKTVLQMLDLDFDGVPEPHQVADTLVIDCVAPVGGLVVDLAPQQDGLPQEVSSSTGTNAGVLAGVAVAAATLALGGAAWYARRRAR